MRTLPPLPLSKFQEKLLLLFSAIGLIGLNGVFLWHAINQTPSYEVAKSNPVYLVFVAEAFCLMFLGAWIVQRTSSNRYTWLAFIAASFLGSLAFSVPLFLYLASRRTREGATPAPQSEI